MKLKQYCFKTACRSVINKIKEAPADVELAACVVTNLGDYRDALLLKLRFSRLKLSLCRRFSIILLFLWGFSALRDLWVSPSVVCMSDMSVSSLSAYRSSIHPRRQPQRQPMILWPTPIIHTRRYAQRISESIIVSNKLKIMKMRLLWRNLMIIFIIVEFPPASPSNSKIWDTSFKYRLGHGIKMKKIS